MAESKALPASKLCRKYDLKTLGFTETSDLEDLHEPLGQDRAIQAIRFGIGVRHQGFNLFAFGPPGSGKTEIIHHYLEPEASSLPVPEDWCYVNNFTARDHPKILRLPAGRGRELARQMESLTEEVRVVISAAYESEDYRTRFDVITEQFKLQQEEAFEDLQKKAAAKNISLVRTPMGLALAPSRDGKVVDPEVFSKLPSKEQERIKEEISELEGELQAAVRMLPELERQQRQEIKKLNREVTSFAVDHLIDETREKWRDCEAVVVFLDEVQGYVIDHSDVFRLSRDEAVETIPAKMAADFVKQQDRIIGNCQVNVLVSHDSNGGAPVVYEDNPTVENLLGRIEHRSEFGSLVTDFRLVKPGALHRANGGYLILDARRLLLQPYAWETLKRELRSCEIRIESLTQMMSLGSIVSLQPETIPLDVKVILIGDPFLYYMLSQNDPDFHNLFKVPVDFDDRLKVNDDAIGLYARYIATEARKNKLLPLEREAVELVMERMTRLTGDSERLSNHTRSLSDLLSEADHWASSRGVSRIEGKDVNQAIQAHIYRSDRMRERTQEQFQRGTMMLDTSGIKVGQINGLSVLQLGDFSFGRPSRITARVHLGRGRVIDIEREVELGGPLHSKGVLILSNFIAARYSADKPLSLNASLVFEQSYGGVDGDSASSAELYALLSALSDIPIKQSLAVTGSVNQFGEVQAIGGVNEKIEGFFDLCNFRGLTGDQGVMIPESNVKNLMLKDEILEAAKKGKFHIYPVMSIDEGIEILTDASAGQPDKSGNYPPDTINGRVKARLEAFADSARKHNRQGRDVTKTETGDV
ncbi:ATP-binding protein [uncultured Sneathiella sp.]|jgi:lon-related putative ATP-dependent protease|uniref:ATP-binding protein n=1 Tax=uncultured Sneathiella sp. TaxID=879315 RepID=UPI0030DAF08E|tara:strand:- start:37475 stop:39919 length:2445 start_codon:yes stop_codon:yes gene_type:complete